MKQLMFCVVIIVLSASSCNTDQTDVKAYPKKFEFYKSQIMEEKAYVIGDNESYSEINSIEGNLKLLKSEVTTDLFAYIRNLGNGTFIESIELLSKDSVRLYTWLNGMETSFDLSANSENATGEIINTSLYGYTIVWDKNKQELSYCLALTLEILKKNGNFNSQIEYDLCGDGNIGNEFSKILKTDDFQTNDTLGIYLLKMIYK
jgi:hypothetical protein